jgi:hypothetical protein
MGRGQLGAGWVDNVGHLQPMKHIRPISRYIWLDEIYSLQFSIKIYFYNQFSSNYLTTQRKKKKELYFASTVLDYFS